MADNKMNFHAVTVSDRAAGHSWPVSPYCETPAEAVRLARLTWQSRDFWDVTPDGQAAEPTIRDFRTHGSDFQSPPLVLVASKQQELF